MRPTNSRVSRPAAAAVALTVLGLSVSCSDGGGTDGGVEVTFTVPDQSLTAATASYTSVPLQAGYFADEGLDVTVQPVDTALSAVQAVATGQAFMTYASTGATISAAQQDDSLAVIGLTNGNIFRVVVPEDSDIQDVGDLEGKTVGANSLASATALSAKGVVGEAGLVPEADVEYLPTGYGAQTAAAFDNGEIDAYSGYDGPNVVVGDLLGTTMREIPSPINDITGTSALVVSQSAVDNEPERVAGMARAFFKAMVFSEENPEAAIAMHWEEFPQSRSAEMVEDEAMDQAVRILSQRMAATAGEGTEGRFGVQDDADVQETLDFFASYGIIPTEVDVDESDLFDYALADRYNDFDADEVRKQAAEWEGQ